MAKNRPLPRHLLVIRTSAMGDVAMLPHALRALRAAYPDLRITVATPKLFHPFFEELGVEMLDVDTKGRHHALWNMLQPARQAHRLGIDAVADVHGVMRSALFRNLMRLYGARVARIDKEHAQKRRFIRQGGAAAEPLRHTVLRYCDVFRQLGFVFDDPAPALRTSRPEPLGAKPAGERWVGFAPFSAQQGKTYPDDLSREAVRLLAARCDRLFIHSGGGREAAFAHEMERTYSNVTALYGKIGLGDEMNLIASLDCVVSMDSLVMHLASLVATPVVSVWGATHPGLGFLGWGCDPRNVLQADMACRPCSTYGAKECRYGDYRCLRAVTPQAIADKVEEVLNAIHNS
ncbi:MAG: glycosyltransferase family 9 protein [Alistipes sp.]|nr:glycosyltransferase family 9 protein [Alistipes senegalensis]MCM1250871.1 glycosyltransferase family 9 protein [Alistipes sp.]